MPELLELRAKLKKIFYLAVERPIQQRKLASIQETREKKLDARRIAELQNTQIKMGLSERRRRYFRSRPIEQTVQGLALYLVDQLLKEDPSCRSILNIGVRYGYSDYVLATSHPQIKFTGIDLYPDIQELNQEFKRPNLQFVSGYALNELEANTMQADAVIFSSTASVIEQTEFEEYLRIISENSRYLILNEPLFPGFEEFKDKKSIPMYAYKRELCWAHAYRTLLEKQGYSCIFYRVIKPSFCHYSLVQIIAKTSP